MIRVVIPLARIPQRLKNEPQVVVHLADHAVVYGRQLAPLLLVAQLRLVVMLPVALPVGMGWIELLRPAGGGGQGGRVIEPVVGGAADVRRMRLDVVETQDPASVLRARLFRFDVVDGPLGQKTAFAVFFGVFGRIVYLQVVPRSGGGHVRGVNGIELRSSSS